ncbi:MAG: DUF4012 domain-containing protein, partial [Actinomycetota bacterium]
MTEHDAPTGLIGAGALLLTLGGVLLWLNMLSGPVNLGAGLLEARSHLTKAQQALENTAFKKATRETYAAQGAVIRARRGFDADSPLMDLATLSPTVDDAMTELPRLLNAVGFAADAASGTLEIGVGALRGPDMIVTPDPDDAGGSIIRIDRIEALSDTLRQIRADITAAGAEFQEIDLQNLPRRLHDEVRDGIDEATSTDQLLARVQAGFEVLPEILGRDEPRTYVIGFQNSAELRGSGGALLQFEFLTIEDGRPQLASSTKGS